MITPYTYTYNLGTYIQGDTIDEFSIRLTKESDGAPIVPDYVCAQVFTEPGRVMHEWEAEIAVDGTVTMPPVIANWPAMTYQWRAQYHVNGRVRTYIEGQVRIVNRGVPCNR